jgi:6-phosphofructokinase 1
VNVMGRASGFIAMQASMASGVVDVCLIPEITFTLEKLGAHIDDLLSRRGHCVICLAEGAGQVCMARSCWSVVHLWMPITVDAQLC